MKPLLIALFFISCTDFSRPNLVAAQSKNYGTGERVDTANAKMYIVTTKPDIFETAFFLGTKAKMDTFPISFYPVDIGQINIESGKVIACDPIVMHDAAPFLQTFPIGRFPVQLAVAKVNDDERVAYSRILFSDRPVVRWEFALQKGQKPMPIGGESFYGYGVDGGIGLFIDQRANNAYNELSKNNEKLWEEVFINEMDKHSRPTWHYVLHEFGAHNFASFSTGYGDGSYATYIGYDEKGKICRLLTDFGLLDWWKK
jgi:hypothetical protein